MLLSLYSLLLHQTMYQNFMLILRELTTITQKFYAHFAGAYNHHTKTFILILVVSSGKMSIKVFV
jgi:hypothetical protein